MSHEVQPLTAVFKVLAIMLFAGLILSFTDHKFLALLVFLVSAWLFFS
jgi:hypothetical protein